MKKPRRITPFKQKAKRGKNQVEKSALESIEEDKAKNLAKLELMTKEELAVIQETTARNALSLFNKLIEEMQRRLPQMTDEVLATSLLSVWDKTSGGKK